MSISNSSLLADFYCQWRNIYGCDHNSFILKIEAMSTRTATYVEGAAFNAINCQLHTLIPCLVVTEIDLRSIGGIACAILLFYNFKASLYLAIKVVH